MPLPSRRPLVLLLGAVPLLLPLNRPLFGLPAEGRLLLGLLLVAGFLASWRLEPPDRRRRYLALALPLGLLALAPVGTDLGWRHVVALGAFFGAVLVVPAVLLRGEGVLTYRFLPWRFDPVDVAYTLLSVPLAWAAFRLYFGVLSPETPRNWVLPPEPEAGSLLALFLGINAVGVWDELFFVNVCFAVLRSLFPLPTANLGQAVVYTTVLYEMAFTGWGPVLVFALALTQGLMYERSKVLLWVLVVHLVVDYFLFQGIVDFYYPDLRVWWHP